jgi:hypothetical protein
MPGSVMLRAGAVVQLGYTGIGIALSCSFPVMRHSGRLRCMAGRSAEPGDDRDQSDRASTDGSADGVSGDFEVTEAQAEAAWRRGGRWVFWIGFPVGIVILVLSGLLGHLSLTQLTLLSLGLTALYRAVNILSTGMSALGFGERFAGKRPILPAPISVPMYIIVGILLVISSTRTSIGRRLAPVPTAALAEWDAIREAMKTPAKAVVLVILACFGLVALACLIVWVIESISQLIGRKDRDPDEPNPFVMALGFLFFTVFVWFIFHAVLRYGLA